MDRLAEHEAFLRAIFDAPDDDTPRLVYADFLEENGDPDRAALIRVQCELARLPPAADPLRQAELGQRVGRLVAAIPPADWPPGRSFREFTRGFGAPGAVFLGADDLADPIALRGRVVRHAPEWFGATRLAARPGRPLQPEHVEALFALPFTQQVTEWDLGGHVEEVGAGPETEDAGTFALIDLNEQPVITQEGVEALARHRGARRIEALILTHNNLDNDAARALVQSPHLIRLKRLDLLQGNRLQGRTWQQLREKFGADVVG